jgi:hypothetical protein
MGALLVFFMISQQWSTSVNLGIPGIDDMYPQTCHMQYWNTDAMCLVWQAYHNSNWEIFSRFTNSFTWGDTIRITNDAPDDTRPRVAHDSYTNRFWCVWVKNDDIFAAFSTGTTWSSPEQITSGAPIDGLPSVYCLNGDIWAIWQRVISDSVNIYSSCRSGGVWSSPIPVTNDVYVDNTTPTISESQSYPIVVWERDNDIYYSIYVSGSWQSPQAITSSMANDSVPEITYIDFTGTAVSWQTDEYGDWEVFRTAADTFTTHYRVTNNIADDVIPCPLFYTSVIFQWNVPMIAFTSYRNGNPDVFAWLDWQGAESIDEDPGQDILPMLTANLGVYVWALWQTDRNGDWDIYGSYQYNPGNVAESGGDPAVLWCSVIPNPFRSETRIAYSIGRNATDDIEIRIYDIAGMLVKCFPRITHDALRCTLIWDGTDEQGHVIPPGVYFLCLDTDQGMFRQKIVKTN